jgi:hypothetical protein
MDETNRSSTPEPLSSEAINISHIPVAGLGGLGLVAMAGVVAWNVPSIRVAVAVALATGIAFAVALIVWRRTH